MHSDNEQSPSNLGLKMTDTQNIRLSTVCSSVRLMDILDTHRQLDTPVNQYEIS